MGQLEQKHGLTGYDSYSVRLGDQLRGERATLGRSLLEVQRDLRIKAAYIAAIENCDPSVFPNKGFIAGYVRSYARYLEMDPVEIFDRFCAESGFSGVNSDLQKNKIAPGKVRLPVGRGTNLISGPFGKQSAATRGNMFERISNLPVSALGSVTVLLALIAGLSFGGYAVLQDVQRVEIAAADVPTGARTETAEFAAPGLGTRVVDLGVSQATEEATPVPSGVDLLRLYQPRELEIPVVAARDGPIVEIDPDRLGPFAMIGQNRPLVTAADGDTVAAEEEGPLVREVVGVPKVSIVAVQPAWVRVYFADGSVIFEKTLNAGEVYTLPENTEAPLLRAGNSSSVYLMVEDRPFGPIEVRGGVAKNVSLIASDIETVYPPVSDVPAKLQATLSAMSASASN